MTLRSDHSKVICPNCVHEFHAISVVDQEFRRAQSDTITALRERVADLEREVDLFGAWQKRDVAQAAEIERLRELLRIAGSALSQTSEERPK